MMYDTPRHRQPRTPTAGVALKDRVVSIMILTIRRNEASRDASRRENDPISYPL